jgi:hypothetical protein
MSEMDNMDARDVEAPEADAAEQSLPVTTGDDRQPWPSELPLDANEADVTEQERVVELDEDDYR